MLKQWLDFPFEKQIETTDRLPKILGQKIVETIIRFFIWKTILKLRIDWLKSTAKKLLKQRLDFLYENKIDTMDRLVKIDGQKIVETTARFSI